MRSFSYEIKDVLGLHARPAGFLVREAGGFSSRITVSANGKSASAGQLMMLMGMGIKQGTTVTVSADGPDEEQACAAMKKFFEEHL